MSLPSPEVLDEIKKLITEITGFQEGDENFGICQRYCLSHVVHHSYPFINRTTVKNLINSYVSRFYGHGYFRVSQELNHQVKRFLSNEKLFEKNPQYDIQWCLLSLLSSLSTNLTSVKQLPELLPIDDEEKETEDIDWKEYLTQDLPPKDPDVFNSDSEEFSDDDDNEDECENKSNELQGGDPSKTDIELSQENSDINVIFDNKVSFKTESSSETRRRRIEEFLNEMRPKIQLAKDFKIRGNITEKFDMLMAHEGVNRETQILSEFEVMEYILYQFQTGERIFLRKGLQHPALTSVTEETLTSFLETFQPYFKIIRCFKDFDNEVTNVMYPEKSQERSFQLVKGNQSASPSDRKKGISNVLYIYNVMLRKVLESFQNEITETVENLENYTLIKMEQKLQPHFFSLSSLFHFHNLATKNWKKDCNWMSSIRVLSVLHNAIMDGTSLKMSFLYLNLFLHCFQVYLNTIDLWISSLDLIDPNDEFIVVRSDGQTSKSENSCCEYEIRSYETEIESSGVKTVPVLDFIAKKMVHVGQSLDVLKRLNRFVPPRTDSSGDSSYHFLIKIINEKIHTLGKVPVRKEPKPQEKKKSIFTMSNISFGLERDRGGGDSSAIGLLLMEELKAEEEEEKKKENERKAVSEIETKPKNENEVSSCREFIYSMVRNPYFEMTFDGIGMKTVERKLGEAKAGKAYGVDEELMIVKKLDEEKSGVYPFHKIIFDAFHGVLGDRVSDACALVKEIVLKECDLPTHLSLLRSILLFNNSYLIQPFILAFFTQPVIWGSAYSLSLHLKECVRGLYKDQAGSLSVTLTKNGFTRIENILEVINAITVNYEVKWPLTLIFTPGVMRMYNEIFRLALKLKWAHWALSGLDFQSENITKSTRHRLQLLRFWFLSALGRINNYFMAQMIPPELELSPCTDLKDIIHAHTKFIENVHRNCLLGEKSSEGKKLILDTLIPLCMNLRLEGTSMEIGKLSAMEQTFGSCHLQLSRLMSSLEK